MQLEDDWHGFKKRGKCNLQALLSRYQPHRAQDSQEAKDSNGLEALSLRQNQVDGGSEYDDEVELVPRPLQIAVLSVSNEAESDNFDAGFQNENASVD